MYRTPYIFGHTISVSHFGRSVLKQVIAKDENKSYLPSRDSYILNKWEFANRMSQQAAVNQPIPISRLNLDAKTLYHHPRDEFFGCVRAQ